MDQLQPYTCLECGRCTAICPVSQSGKFSPRQSLSKYIAQGADSMDYPELWSCLTCRLCEQVCPAALPYSELNRSLRVLCRQKGIQKKCNHGGVFEQISILQSRPGLQQNRLGWLTEDLQLKAKTSTIFFVGCTPYFAAYFGSPYAENLVTSLRGAVCLLNKIGIQPHIMSNERCCGHDLRLRGEEEMFFRHLDLTEGELIRAIEETGAQRIVTFCPECMNTLKEDYSGLGVEILHLSQLLESYGQKLTFKKSKPKKVTFQDPCRLGRYGDIYEQPRYLIQAVDGVQLQEMEHCRKHSICCGNTAWINCDQGTKRLQQKRLAEAGSTGAEILLTACPKCLVHLTCFQQGSDNKKDLVIRDLWDFLAFNLL